MIRSRLLPAVLLLSAIAASAPRFADDVRIAWDFRSLSWEQRREMLMPGFYANVERLRHEIHPGAPPVALVASSRPTLDQAVFLNYYLFPARARICRDRWEFLTLNPRPAVIVRPSDAKIVSYAELRNDDVRQTRIVRRIDLPAQELSRFIIPVVSSTDGMPPAAYTVEGAIAAEPEARVTLTLQPAGISRTLDVRGTRTFNDLVYDCFGRMVFAAWIEVASDRPVRAAFWFVNQVARSAAAIPLIDGPLRAPVAFPALPPPTRLWLLNPANSMITVHIGSESAIIGPRALIATRAAGAVSGPVWAFLSRKLPDGSTQFTWPEDVR